MRECMQTDNELISVIVPVYNAEEYIERSVLSIVGQTYERLEIILVDDGSSDSSGSLCDAFAEKDSRIVVIHKENGGASSARNAALDIAKGSLVGFADADDWLEKDMYQRLNSLIVETGADIAACGVRLCTQDGKSSYWSDNLELKKEFDRDAALTELLEEKLLTFGLWNKLFRREVIGSQRFVEGIIYEDNEFLPKCFAKADKVVYTGATGYNHFLSSFSVMRGEYSIKHFDLINVCRENVSFYEKECPAALNLMKSRYISAMLNAIYKSYCVPEWEDKRNELIKEVSNRFPREILDCLGKKDRIKYNLCRMSPDFYSKLMRYYRVRFVGDL